MAADPNSSERGYTTGDAALAVILIVLVAFALVAILN